MELHKIFMILLFWYVAQSKTLALFPILCNIPYLSDLHTSYSRAPIKTKMSLEFRAGQKTKKIEKNHKFQTEL